MNIVVTREGGRYMARATMKNGKCIRTFADTASGAKIKLEKEVLRIKPKRGPYVQKEEYSIFNSVYHMTSISRLNFD